MFAEAVKAHELRHRGICRQAATDAGTKSFTAWGWGCDKGAAGAMAFLLIADERDAWVDERNGDLQKRQEALDAKEGSINIFAYVLRPIEELKKSPQYSPAPKH